MRTAAAGSITSLLGSLGLHGMALLLLVLAARRAPETAVTLRERPDTWVGNAVEVDALASPEATPNLANAASAPIEAAPNPVNPPSTPRLAPEKAEPVAPAARLTPPPTPRVPKPRAKAVALPAGDAGSHEATAPAPGAFGSEGLPPGVRSLPSAFTRAIPPATGADPIWQRLPVGTERPFVVAVQVDAEGHISSSQIVAAADGRETAEQFEHLRQRVVALLGGGLFALQNNAGAGRALFRVTITLSDRAVHEESAPGELVERGFEPPQGARSGRAYFTLASGRHFEAKVDVLSTSR